MRWNYLTALALLAAIASAKEEDNSNEVSLAAPSINLNVNFRKALLKALIELENEDNNSTYQNDAEKNVEKASASALSVYTSSEEISSSAKPSTEKTEDPRESVLVQRSQAVQQSPITTLEKEELDPFNDAEQILTSASSSFTIPNTNNFRSTAESRSVGKTVSNHIEYEKPTTESDKVEFTTTRPSVSTEESEAKAEEIQFFSAPLVAAFTVHQDDRGVPKKVESILRPPLKKEEAKNLVVNDSGSKTVEKVQVADPQAEFLQKQKLLEQEIVRLNSNLKQQQLLNQQQQEIFIKQQQEQLRLRNNAQPFLPIISPVVTQFDGNVNTEKPIVNQFITQSLPTKPAQQFKTEVKNNNSGVSLISSISYDHITEAGKLPANAQVLPIKGPINFHTPIIQTTGFQQYHSIPQVTPLITTFSPLQISQPHFIVNDQQGKRTFRQEVDTGNYLNNDFNRGSSFSIHRSVQQNVPQQVNPNFVQYLNTFPLVQPQQANRIFRSNLEGALTSPQQTQNYRFFRSNLAVPNNFVEPQSNNYQLRNLLYNSGAFRNKEPEDISIISKVLSLNHSSGLPYVSSNFYGKK